MKRCFIFAAGTFFGLRERPGTPDDLVIAADAGYETCRTAGITPDVILGDFDSMDAPEGGPGVIRLPVEKDDTDTMAAVKLGLERGCKEFYIYGGTGGKASGSHAGQSSDAVVPAPPARAGFFA